MFQQYAGESALSRQYQDALEQKDQHIAKLKKAHKESQVGTFLLFWSVQYFDMLLVCSVLNTLQHHYYV